MTTKADWMSFYLDLNSQENDHPIIGGVIIMFSPAEEVERGNK